jgi:tagatose-6-phosphate ketose/aldose isomerase
MKKGKKALYTIAIFESPVNGLKFDLEIRLSDSENQLDEELLTVCDILPSQLLGFFKSLELGLKPDSPSESGAISRVVENVTIYEY